MKTKELIELIKHYIELDEEGELDFDYVGVRYENKERSVGEELEVSKYNDGREDEREFPEHSDEGYEELPDADGTSAWELSAALEELEGIYNDRSFWKKEYGENMHASTGFEASHCYIIGGDHEGYEPNHVVDCGEVVIKDAIVMKVIF